MLYLQVDLVWAALANQHNGLSTAKKAKLIARQGGVIPVSCVEPGAAQPRTLPQPQVTGMVANTEFAVVDQNSMVYHDSEVKSWSNICTLPV